MVAGVLHRCFAACSAYECRRWFVRMRRLVGDDTRVPIAPFFLSSPFVRLWGEVLPLSLLLAHVHAFSLVLVV